MVPRVINSVAKSRPATPLIDQECLFQMAILLLNQSGRVNTVYQMFLAIFARDIMLYSRIKRDGIIAELIYNGDNLL